MHFVDLVILYAPCKYRLIKSDRIINLKIRNTIFKLKKKMIRFKKTNFYDRLYETFEGKSVATINRVTSNAIYTRIILQTKITHIVKQNNIRHKNVSITSPIRIELIKKKKKTKGKIHC